MGSAGQGGAGGPGWGSGAAGHVPFLDLGVGFVKSVRFLKIHQAQHLESEPFSAQHSAAVTLLLRDKEKSFLPQRGEPTQVGPEFPPLENPCRLKGIVFKMPNTLPGRRGSVVGF